MALGGTTTSARIFTSMNTKTTSDREFVHSRCIDAPREQVFDALADGRTYPDW